MYTINVDGTGLRQLTDGRRPQLRRRLAARRPHRVPLHPRPAGRLLLLHAGRHPVHDERRRLGPAADLGQLPERLHARRDERRADHLRPLGVCRPARHPDPEPVDDQSRRHDAQGFFGNRVLDPATFIEPQAIPGSTRDPVHADRPQRFLPRRDRPDRPQPRRQRPGGDPQPDAGGAAARRRRQHQRAARTVPDAVPAGRPLLPGLVRRHVLLRDYDGSSRRWCWRRARLGFYNPRPLRPRARPPVRVVQLARRGGGRPWAAVYLQDVYNGLEPHVQPGEVKQIAVVQEMRRTLINSPASTSRRSASSGCWSPAAPPTCRRRSGALPTWPRTARRTSRCPPGSRSTSWRWTPKAARCSGCGASRTSCPARSRAASAATSRGSQTPQRQLPLAALGEPQTLQPPEWGVQGFCYARDRPAGARPALRRVPQPAQEGQGIDLTATGPTLQRLLRDARPPEPGPDRQPLRELDPHLQRPRMEHPGDHAEGLGLARQQAGRPDPDRPPRREGQAARAACDAEAGAGS